ncbi:MAG: GAF domain-containing SpoIIE family protein phosphatase [Arthrobacter sp.]
MTDQSRIAALHSLQLMDTPAEERFDGITRAARELFGVPLAAVNLLDSDHLFVKSPQGMARSLVPPEETFCDATITAPEILVVPDATADRSFAGLPDVAGGRGVRFYAGRPLTAEPGTRVGTFCLFDTRPRELSAAELQQLDELGAWAEAEIQDSADRDRARAVQQALLPGTTPAGPEYQVAGLCLPRTDVGGDFYSWQESGGNLRMAIADVMGKGTAAALIAATVRIAIHSTDIQHPGSVLDIASGLLTNDLDRTSTFATAFLATLETATGNLQYADAGHGLTMIVSPDGSHRRLHGNGLPLGFGEPGSWATSTTTLGPGDTLASFTDGVLDLYGGTLAALGELAAILTDTDPSGVIQTLRSRHARAESDDDLTAILVRRRTAPN